MDKYYSYIGICCKQNEYLKKACIAYFHILLCVRLNSGVLQNLAVMVFV